VLAGRDATVALATMDLSDAAFEPGAAARLTPQHTQSLQSWVQRFASKYQVCDYDYCSNTYCICQVHTIRRALVAGQIWCVMRTCVCVRVCTCVCHSARA
jgi:hypothetical protein